MVSAVKQVKQVIGSDKDLVSDKEIRDSLWDSYFDVEGTVGYLLDELHKRELKKKRKQEQGEDSLSHQSQSHSSAINLDKETIKNKMEGLSLQPTTPTPTPNPSNGSAKPSKLSSKIALSKSFTTTPSNPSSASQTPTTTRGEGTKKPLSKLQQKMLLSKSKPKTSLVNPSSEPTPTIAPTLPEDTTMSVDLAPSLPVSFEPSPFLLAPPSSFASALKPHHKEELKAGKELAEHLAKSSPVELGGGRRREGWGLSPDDRVLEARKGTALGKESVKRK